MKNSLNLFSLLLIAGGTAATVWHYRTPKVADSPGHSIDPGNELSAYLPDSGLVQTSDGKPGNLPNQKDSIIISDAITYRNLQIFFISSRTEISGERYIALDEALNTKKIRVKETEDVNQLKADNLSDKYIYINSGDIVRGGKQDRTIQYDVIIAPGARNIDLASFCVESGRWDSRGDESVETFTSSKNSLSSKELKIAAKVESDQSQVWEKVNEYQVNANANISHSYHSYGDVEVRSGLSASSLDLTLENETIKDLKADYMKAINRYKSASVNANGIACFINGKMASIDVFNNKPLFDKMLGKLIDAAVAEAISEDASKNYTAVNTESLRIILNQTTIQNSVKNINKLTKFISYAGSKGLMKFTTEDRELHLWLHKNCLMK